MIKNVVYIFCFSFFIVLNCMEKRPRALSKHPSEEQVRLAEAYLQIAFNKKMAEAQAAAAAAREEHGSDKDTGCSIS